MPVQQRVRVGSRYDISRLIGCLVWMLTAATLCAQQSRGHESLSACVLVVVDLSDSPENAQFQDVIRSQLELELGNVGFEVVDALRWQAARDRLGYDDRDLAVGTRAVEVGDAIGAQIVVTGFYRIEGGRIVLELKAYDVLQRAFITGVLRTGTVDLSMYTLIDTAVARMLPEIRLLAAGPLPKDVQQVKEITLYSRDEDAQVYLAGEQLVGRIQQGVLTLPYFPLAVGSTIRVEKRKEGYYTSSEDLEIGQPRVEITLRPMARKTRWATELTWSTKQLVGFGLAQRWYPMPDILFLAFEHYFYLQHNFAEGGKAVLHNDFELLVGGYPFSRVDARFRVAFSTGLGMIVTYFSLPDQPVYTDFYFNVINLSVEWNWRRWMTYLRTETLYGLGIGPNLLGRGMLGNGPVFTLGVMYKW
jgi:hypothetical protein